MNGTTWDEMREALANSQKMYGEQRARTKEARERAERHKADLTRVTAERDKALKRKDEWHDRFNTIAAERAAMKAERDALQAKVDAVRNYLENVGLTGTTWTAEDSERDVLAILTAPVDVESGE
jgi:uncharacterized coiled-coil DUF342 family protein